jgi:tetratricopeptide (TPR) repeat protein
MPCIFILRFLPKISLVLCSSLALLFFFIFVSSAGASKFYDNITKSYYYFLLSNISAKTPEEAVELLKKAIKANPGSLFLKRSLLVLYLQAGKFDEAENHGESLLKKYPEDKETVLLLSKAYLLKERSYKAISLLEKYLDKNPKDEEALSLLTSVYLQKKEWDLALASLEKLIKLDPNNHVAWLYKARVHKEKKDYEQAKSAYLKALELSDGSHPIFIEALRFLEEMRDYQTIEKLVINSLNKNPEDQALFRYLLGFYLERKDWEKSEELLKKQLSQNKAQPEFLFYLALTLEYKGKEEEALKIYESIPQDTLWYFEGLKRSFFIYKKSDPEKAISLIKKFTPTERGHFVFKAQALDQLDLCEEGIKVAEEGLKRFQDDEELLFVLAGNLACLEQYEKVIQTLEPLLKKKPDDPYLLNFIGYSLVELNRDLDRAEAFLLKAHNSKPDDPYIEDSLGWHYYKKGDYTKAKEHLERAISNLKEDEPVIFEHLGDVYLALGDKNKACEWYKRAEKSAFRRVEKERILSKVKGCEK